MSSSSPLSSSSLSLSSSRSWYGTALLLGVLAVSAAACGNLPPSATPASAAARARPGPDDSNPAALVPAGARTVIDVDVSALRKSAWTAPLIAARDQRTQAAQTEALGYDEVSDVDRIIYVVTEAGADAPTLVIAQGRFQAARLDEAFRTRWPAATVDGWRGISMVSSGENAFTSLTSRTFVSGSPASVRAVIDRAFGVGGDLEGDPHLGVVNRALHPGLPDVLPAMAVLVVVDDRLRARARDVMQLPRDLHQVGLRVDVQKSFDLLALGFLDDRDAAASLAQRVRSLLSSPVTQLGLRALGLGALLADTRVIVEGTRVQLRATVADEQRADLTTALQALIRSARGDAGGGALELRSW